jgi:tRNA A-37 threonylcarbamoyl transferase component Bud32
MGRRGEGAELERGQIFHGRYDVARIIRAGGMGTVYEVVDRRTRRRRALKVMHPSLAEDRDLRARFELEARVTADVESRHLVETFDAGVDADTGSPFLVMELLRGEDLGTRLKRDGRLPAAQAVQVLGDVARALELTHAAGIVHRDLKPDNLFLARREDGTVCLKILDFGVAKLVAQSSQSFRTTRSIGTPVYMSPEQVRGDASIGPQADLYALGHVAYALLVGEAYWETEARAHASVFPLLMNVAKGATEPATVRAGRRGIVLPAPFDEWFSRATAPEVNDRFATASDLVEALAEALGVEPPAVAGPSTALPVPATLDGSTDVATPTRLTATVTHAERAPGLRRAGWLAAGVVVLGLAGTVAALGVGRTPPVRAASTGTPVAPAAQPVPVTAPSTSDRPTASGTAVAVSAEPSASPSRSFLGAPRSAPARSTPARAPRSAAVVPAAPVPALPADPSDVR